MAGVISSGSSLTAAQLAKLAALPAPIDYDDGRPLVARKISAIPAAAKLAINIDGSAATDIRSGGHTLEFVGDGVITTAQAWAGDSCISLPAVSDGAYVAASSDFDPRNNNFIAQFAFRNTTSPPFVGDGIGVWGGATTDRAWHLSFRTNGSAQTLRFAYYPTASPPSQGALVQREVTVPHAMVTAGEWHVARACRVNDTLFLSVNEQVLGSFDMTGVDIWDDFTGSPTLEIGGLTGGEGALVGFMDGVYIQIGGSVEGPNHRVDRTLFSSTDKLTYQPEQTGKVQVIDLARTVVPIPSEVIYVFTANVTATLEAMADWPDGYVPHFFGIGSIAFYAGDTVNGDAGPISLPAANSHCKIRKRTATTATAEGDFITP